jgi:hypothetical protein
MLCDAGQHLRQKGTGSRRSADGNGYQAPRRHRTHRINHQGYLGFTLFRGAGASAMNVVWPG